MLINKNSTVCDKQSSAKIPILWASRGFVVSPASFPFDQLEIQATIHQGTVFEVSLGSFYLRLYSGTFYQSRDKKNFEKPPRVTHIP